VHQGGLRTHQNNPEHKDVSGEVRVQITNHRDPMDW
jgi:hypothetical protein